MSNLEEELNEVVPTVLQSIINIFMVRQVGPTLKIQVKSTKYKENQIASTRLLLAEAGAH